MRESIGQHDAPARTQELLALARDKLGEGRVALLWASGIAQEPGAVARWILDQKADAGDVREPAALLPSLPATLFVSSPGPAVREPRYATLTAREREIAGLLTEGLSNRAVAAAQLVISPATVARHVANIMEKLGFGSRAQIAVWAAEHGLDNR